MEEINDLTRIAYLAMEGMKFGVVASKESLKMLGRLAKTIYCAVKYNRVRSGKAKGINPMKKLKKMDPNVSCVKISKENLKHFEKLAKKHSIYYVEMPAYSSASNQDIVHIMYHTSSAPSMESVMETLQAEHFNENDGKETMEEYIANSGMDKLTDAQFLKELKNKYPEQYKELAELTADAKKNVTLEKKIKEAIWENAQQEKSRSEDYRIIYINKDQLVKENRDEVMIRTGKEDDSYIWLDKSDFRNWKDGTFAVAVHKDKDIRITNFEETEHYMIKGDEMKYHVDSQYQPVTISRKMIKEETETQYMTKIPGTHGKEYLWIDKNEAKEEQQGKSLKFYLEADSSYAIVDADNNFVRNAMGRELSANYAPLWIKDSRSEDRVKKSSNKMEKNSEKTKKSSNKMEQTYLNNNQAVKEITITKQIILRETETQYMTRIPGTKAELYLWVDKNKTSEEHNGKSIKTFLDMDATYSMVDKNNNFVGNISGRQLYNGHYDPFIEKAWKKKTGRRVERKPLSI